MIAKKPFGDEIVGLFADAFLSESLRCVFVRGAIPDVMETKSELTLVRQGQRDVCIVEPLPEVCLIGLFTPFVFPLRFERIDNQIALVFGFQGPAWLHSRVDRHSHTNLSIRPNCKSNPQNLIT